MVTAITKSGRHDVLQRFFLSLENLRICSTKRSYKFDLGKLTKFYIVYHVLKVKYTMQFSVLVWEILRVVLLSHPPVIRYVDERL